MKSFKFVFVVLVYRNGYDLEDLITSIRKHLVEDYRVIVVNSYYDEESNETIRMTAKKNNCDFLCVENKGYGFGNNCGIGYVNKNYKYDYLVISNPDIIIEKFDTTSLNSLNTSVIGPMIITKTRKRQNPYWFIKNTISEYLLYFGYRNSIIPFIYSGIIFNKIIREIFLFYFIAIKKHYHKVFALHGCFLIFSTGALELIGLPFNEKMFLFAEESYLAHILKQKNIDSYIVKDIQVLHKEDGSLTMSSINVYNEIRKSVVTYYEELIIRKKMSID